MFSPMTILEVLSLFQGEYAIVGTSNSCFFDCFGSEKAYIFKRENGIWVEQAIITPTDSDENDFFSTAVDIHGEYAIIGAFADDIWRE